MSSSFCSVYTGSGQAWPVRQFPSSSFPRGSPARLREAARAWAFFEQVEAYDAAIRVKYSALGGFVPSSKPVVTQSPWYIFKNEGERVVYKRGQSLHRELCPGINWTPQRNLGIPNTSVSNVYPTECPTIAESDPCMCFSSMGGERGFPSPALSGRDGSLREVSSLGSTASPSLSGSVGKSGHSSTASSSRRNSFSELPPPPTTDEPVTTDTHATDQPINTDTQLSDQPVNTETQTSDTIEHT
jgi:hypothetical protein